MIAAAVDWVSKIRKKKKFAGSWMLSLSGFRRAFALVFAAAAAFLIRVLMGAAIRRPADGDGQPMQRQRQKQADGRNRRDSAEPGLDWTGWWWRDRKKKKISVVLVLAATAGEADTSLRACFCAPWRLAEARRDARRRPFVQWRNASQERGRVDVLERKRRRREGEKCELRNSGS